MCCAVTRHFTPSLVMIVNCKILNYFIESLCEYFGNILVPLIAVVHRLHKILSYLTLVTCLKVWKRTRTHACTHACAQSVVLSQAHCSDSPTDSRLHVSDGWRNKLQAQLSKNYALIKKNIFPTLYGFLFQLFRISFS